MVVTIVTIASAGPTTRMLLRMLVRNPKPPFSSPSEASQASTSAGDRPRWPASPSSSALVGSSAYA